MSLLTGEKAVEPSTSAVLILIKSDNNYSILKKEIMSRHAARNGSVAGPCGPTGMSANLCPSDAKKLMLLWVL
jgi:hypothetical protein